MNADWLGGPKRFPTTSWSLIAQAGYRNDVGREALGDLLHRYLPALRAHLVLSKGVRPDDADDIVHDFVTAKILERDLLASAHQELGKFRTFLLTSLDRFYWNHRRAANARKRTPTSGAEPLGDRAGSVAAPGSLIESCEVAWARSVLGEAVRRMRAHCESSNRPEVWGVFELRVLRPALEGIDAADYGKLIVQFNLQSPSQAFNVLATAKRMFVRLLREVVSEYVCDEREVDEELRELQAALAESRFAGPC
jgi:RNA polymerase sigma-70 factor (ECF subfamily)